MLEKYLEDFNLIVVAKVLLLEDLRNVVQVKVTFLAGNQILNVDRTNHLDCYQV